MKRVNNNYQCLNVTTETYTGKEQSPKGIGFSAIGFDIGFEKEGVDKQLWVVQMKNNKKVWFRKSGMPKVIHEEPLITIHENIIHESINNFNDNKFIDNHNKSIDNDNKSIDNDNKSIDNDNKSINNDNYNNETENTSFKLSSITSLNNNKETKKTDFNIFYKYYSNKLKDENKEKGLNKKPKEIQEETYCEWNRIKKNKDELTELLLLINNKT